MPHPQQFCSLFKPPGANLPQGSGLKVPVGEENLGFNPSSYANSSLTLSRLTLEPYSSCQ